MVTRAGSVLVELLVSAVVSVIVVAAAAVLLQSQGALGRNITTRSERNDAQRTGFAVVQLELRHASGDDLRAVARDSLAVRIFRGLATVCGFNGPDVFVRYRGIRLPDPVKDSALHVGPEYAVAFTSLRPDSTACARSAGEQVLVLRWPAPARTGTTWLIFEHGSYHLNASALRYRLAGSTRQPVTNDIFDDARGGFTPVADSVLRAIDVTLHDRQSGGSARARVRLVNAQ